MPAATTVYLSIPGGSPLSEKLLTEVATRQKAENKAAKSDGRDPRTITIQEAILSILGDQFGITVEPPRRGRRWPKKADQNA